MDQAYDRIDYCDVCGAKGEVWVRASRLGPASFDYCEECISRGAEPFSTVAVKVYMLGGPKSEYLDALASVVTYDDGKYVGLTAVLQQYADMESGIIEEFSPRPYED